MSDQSRAYDRVTQQMELRGTAAATAQMIEKLPRTMTTIPLFLLETGGVDQPWQLSITLTPSEQAVLDGLHPTPAHLWAAAQHALGLAGIGSLIEPARGTVRVRAGEEWQVRLMDASTLWWVANAPPLLLQAFLDHLVAALEQHRGA